MPKTSAIAASGRNTDSVYELSTFDVHVQHTAEVPSGFAKLARGSRVRQEVVCDDSSLARAALAGRAESFGVLVERYERAVYHLCLRTMRDPEEARDCAQEAFFKAYRGLATYKPESKFSTWIFSIAYHACCDRLARRKRFSDEAIPERADPAPGPSQIAAHNEEARALHAAIDALPEKYRTVVTLYHLQGRQYEEIAEVLGLPLGTVKTHLFRAKDQLRRALLRERMGDR